MSRKLDWEKANVNERVIREKREAFAEGERSPGPATPERLNILRYENYQWAVTDFGLEPLVENAGKFRVSVEELAEITEDWRPAFKAPLVIAEESWVDPEALLNAFERAIEFHYPTVDPGETEKLMQNTLLRTRLIAARRRRR